MWVPSLLEKKIQLNSNGNEINVLFVSMTNIVRPSSQSIQYFGCQSATIDNIQTIVESIVSMNRRTKLKWRQFPTTTEHWTPMNRFRSFLNHFSNKIEARNRATTFHSLIWLLNSFFLCYLLCPLHITIICYCVQSIHFFFGERKEKRNCASKWTTFPNNGLHYNITPHVTYLVKLFLNILCVASVAMNSSQWFNVITFQK